MTQPWVPHRRRKDWKNFLTEEESAAVARAEAASVEAKAALAAATAVLNPIRMRACQRRLFAERAQALKDQP